MVDSELIESEKQNVVILFLSQSLTLYSNEIIVVEKLHDFASHRYRTISRKRSNESS